MTPAEHLAEAESILAHDYGSDPGVPASVVQVNLIGALTHAVIAVAAELGVPHPSAPAGGVPSGAS